MIYTFARKGKSFVTPVEITLIRKDTNPNLVDVSIAA